MQLQAIVAAGLGLVLGACVGVIGDAGPAGSEPAADVDAGVDAPPPDFTLTVGGGAQTELGTRVEQTIDVDALNGFTGAVALAASGVPDGWTAELTPATVDVAGGQVAPARAKLVVTIPTDAAPGPTTITVTGSGVPGARGASATITVANTFSLAIGTPGAGGQHFERFANGQLRMRRGATLRIVNTDTIAHRVHSDAGVQGFPHQATSMPSGADYTVTLSSTGSDVFYCHDHGQGTGEVRLTVR